MVHEINKDKLNQLNYNEVEAIRRLRVCQYIPVYESLPFHKEANQLPPLDGPAQKYEFASSQSRQSKSSNSLSNNRKEFLEAFSKYPQ
jgi:hypothetical protein